MSEGVKSCCLSYRNTCFHRKHSEANLDVQSLFDPFLAMFVGYFRRNSLISYCLRYQHVSNSPEIVSWRGKVTLIGDQRNFYENPSCVTEELSENGISHREEFIDIQNVTPDVYDEPVIQSFQPSLPKTKREFESRIRMPFESPSDARGLKVAVMGMPNSGKSSLMNRLVGFRISAVSFKVHTTRRNVIGVWTEGVNQIEFSDSPGLVTTKHCMKHELEQSFMSHPVYSAKTSDMIIVVVDVSNVRERKQLNPGILKTLNQHFEKESILILNKIDCINHKRRLIDILNQLTLGVVNGVSAVDGKPATRVWFPSTKDQMRREDDRHERRIRKKGYILDLKKDYNSGFSALIKDDLGEESNDNHDVDSIEKIDEISSVTLGPLKTSPSEMVEVLQKGLHITPVSLDPVGWPHFSRVFMVSALTGDGIEELKGYLLSRTYLKKWKYNPSIITPQNPVSLVLSQVKEKFLDNLPQEIPYKLKTTVESWVLTRTGTLLIALNVWVPKRHWMSIIIGPSGENISKIVNEAQQILSDSFKCDVMIKIVVKCADNKKNKK